jgi:hypothetical protein
MGWRDYQGTTAAELDEVPILQEPTAPARGGADTGTPSSFRGAVEIITEEGNRLWIATEPAALELIPPGAVFFTPSEIMQLQTAGKEAARLALMVKQIFPGSGKVTIELTPEEE